MTDQAPPQELATWHAGEKAIQESLGVAERMESVGKRVIRNYMPDQHREFYAQVPFIVLGSVDAQGDAWATLLEGSPGFISSPSPATLAIQARRNPQDPASRGMEAGDAIGLLGIELHTRRRNRVNGILGPSPDGSLQFTVDQSFGNCPQYIQLRDHAFVRDPDADFPGEVLASPGIDPAARAMIEAADTFFVASYADRESRRQVDVSHRGGKAGFVRVAPDGTLTIPDFAGNLFFNTLGNILLNGKAGLVFVDFVSGDLLQMTGEAQVILDSPEIAAFQGAERLWSFRATQVLRRPGAMALRWRFQQDGWSPNSLMTGDWQQAAGRVQAAALATRWRPFEITGIVDESRSIRSFHLQPKDGAGRLPHEAGQHLPIRLVIPGLEKPVIRSYTISAAPSDGACRISVKRDGLASQHLHDHVRVGDIIEARAPAGAFTIDAHQKRPAVLLAAGVGITPMIAMLRHLVYEGLRTRGIRPAVLFHAARSLAERPFDRELADLSQTAGGAIRNVRVLSKVEGARQGTDYDAAGRIDMALLGEFLPFGSYDFYLCGPASFTQDLYDALRDYGIPDERIHAEAFGPSSLQRTQPAVALAAPLPPPASSPVSVVFTESAKEARWTPESGSLLELAELRGLSPEFSCRSGSCGSCRTRLLSGSVTYLKQTTAAIGEGEVLLCCAAPAAPAPGQENRIQLAL
ncbi:MAG TPA: pyridoxamine 5'-phosphate oxidase family protein [Solimonas sp.]